MPTIDPEFRSLIPPLSPEELRQLESLILADGCRDALVTWNGIIIDGHNRYDICQRHGLTFNQTTMDFEDREAAKIWVMRNQLGRRNLIEAVRIRIALQMETAIAAKAKAKQRASGGDKVSDTARAVLSNWTEPLDGPVSPSEPVNTRVELAKLANSSTGNIHRAKTVFDKGSDEIKAKMESGEISINAAYKAVRPSPPKEHAEQPTPIEVETNDVPSTERPKPGRENYRINTNRIIRASSLCEEAWTMLNKESFQVSIVEVRGKIKLLREELSELKDSLEKRERHAQAT